MLYDKKTKAFFFEGKEKTEDVLSVNQMNKLSRFLKVYLENLRKNIGKVEELNQLFYMHFGSSEPKRVFEKIYGRPLRELYLIIELFSKVQLKVYQKYDLGRFTSFVKDINNFFMIEQIPLQLIYLQETKDIFMEKIIDEMHSKEVEKTLNNFSKYKKVQDDFKKAIISYSSGDNLKSIEKNCIAIEDYLCVILEKQSCNNVDIYYKKASSILGIPQDIDKRFISMISFIHNYRSKPLHGSKKEHDPENPHLIAQIVIGFTMTILNYLYNINEKS